MSSTLTIPALPRRQAQRPRAGQGGSKPAGHTFPAGRKGERVTAIPGRYTPITTHQLCMVWWLYQAGHITKRQLRVYFAAQEMAERRRYTKPDEKSGGTGKIRRPSYTIDEVRDTIGSKHGETAEKSLSADVKAVGRLGLVKISHRRIEFAVSIDQIAVDDVSGFWDMFEQIKNKARVVPVPRRTCRALAKGMTQGETGMIIALVIRSLFWHKREGEYRIDGRTKCSWIAEVFQLDRKTITTARAKLIAQGWMQEIPCNQWELNKWGQRYRLNLEAFGARATPEATANPADQDPTSSDQSDQEAAPDPQQDATNRSKTPSGFPSPRAELSGVFPIPCLNNSSSPNGENIKNRKPDHGGSGSASGGSRKKKVVNPKGVGRGSKGRDSGGRGRVVLSNVRRVDLDDTERLLELHRQAIKAGHKVSGEKGRLDFVALAERAKSHGNDAPKLFAWLLRQKKFDFITMADEDAAIARLKRHANQGDDAAIRQSEAEAVGGQGNPGGAAQSRKDFLAGLPEDQRFVATCIHHRPATQG